MVYNSGQCVSNVWIAMMQKLKKSKSTLRAQHPVTQQLWSTSMQQRLAAVEAMHAKLAQESSKRVPAKELEPILKQIAHIERLLAPLKKRQRATSAARRTKLWVHPQGYVEQEPTFVAGHPEGGERRDLTYAVATGVACTPGKKYDCDCPAGTGQHPYLQGPHNAQSIKICLAAPDQFGRCMCDQADTAAGFK